MAEKPNKPQNPIPKVDRYSVKVDYQGKPDTSYLKELSEVEIKRLLTVIPETKGRYGSMAMKALERYERAKLATKHEYARLRLVASAGKETMSLSSDKDRESWVLTQQSYRDKQQEELDAMIEYKLAELRHTFLEDQFAGVRKQANLVEKQNDTQRQFGKYAQPEG